MYRTSARPCQANFFESFVGNGFWAKGLDISKRYSGLAEGFYNSCSNISFYALSATMIGNFLAAGKCTLTRDKAPMTHSTWSGVVNGTCDSQGNNCIGLTPSLECSADMQSCMSSAAAQRLEESDGIDASMEALLVEDPDVQLCKDTWKELFRKHNMPKQ